MLKLFPIIVLIGCKDQDSSTVHIDRIPDPVPLREWTEEVELTEEWFRRVSLDIRGVRPTESELEWMHEHPESLSTVLDEWLSEDAFGQQMAWYWNDLLHTAVWPMQAARFERFMLSDEDKRSLGWEPLSYVEQVVNGEGAFSELVTTDKVPTNPNLASIFGDDYSGTTWGMHSTDRDHPSAGLLASRVLWIRHYANPLNHNRVRANFFTTTFLCLDFLERDVQFDFSNVNLDEIDHAISVQSECVTCHSSLDPLAVVFGSFQEGLNLDLDQMGVASDFKERWFVGWKEPSYFGLPLNNLSDLGAYTATDIRFSQCMAEHTWDFLIERSPITELDRISLGNAFVQSGHSMQELVKLIVQTPEYVQQNTKVLRIEQLHQVLLQLVADNSADRAIFDELIWNPKYRVMFGSTDDVDVLSTSPAFTVGHHLVLRWIVEQMGILIEEDLQRPLADRAVLTRLSDDSQVAIADQVMYWKRTLHGEWVSLEDASFLELLELWDEVRSEDGDVTAWTTIMAVLIHDPAMVMK